ncbi:hypothetical protein CCR85_01140 [Rhodothalassium salexigens]|uniref:hypothetical protein n=1 Tax=Rhodothalassium salexigens TaxID=1086 RepID=UPI001911D416|nr:hypothetical protein [Rhodothalassium salexigens]MBK5910098.1 hypothetical protein [Rhodothalassium salexigens]MBK5920711.1 hypothetical protein [Rhodothalassium salexigens]
MSARPTAQPSPHAHEEARALARAAWERLRTARRTLERAQDAAVTAEADWRAARDRLRALDRVLAGCGHHLAKTEAPHADTH